MDIEIKKTNNKTKTIKGTFSKSKLDFDQKVFLADCGIDYCGGSNNE